MNEDNVFRFDLWLYNELKKRKMTQRELAEKAQLSLSTISYLLSNHNEPTLKTFALILKALDKHVEIVDN